jgi:hypothetical protein
MKKAQAGLFIIGVMAALLIAMNMIMYVFIVLAAQDSQNMFFISIKDNEQGAGMKSLLGEGDPANIMVIGNLAAEGGEARFSGSEEHIMKTIQLMGRKCMIVYDKDREKPIKEIGDCDDNNEAWVAQVPLPGAGKSGDTRLMVRII